MQEAGCHEVPLDELPLYIDEEPQEVSCDDSCECENHDTCGCDHYGYN